MLFELLKKIFKKVFAIRCFALLVLLNLVSLNYVHANIDSLKVVLKHEKVDSNKVKILIKIAEKYNVTQVDSSIYYYKKALAISEKSKLIKLEINVTIRIVELLTDAGINEFLHSFMIEKFKRFDKMGVKQGCLELAAPMGYYYQISGSYDSSMFYYNYCLKNTNQKNRKYKTLVSNALRGRANLYADNGNYVLAIDDLQKALTIVDTSNYPVLLGIESLLSSVYLDFGDYQEALKYCKKAQKTAINCGDGYSLGATIYTMADIYSHIDNRKSIEYGLQGLRIFDSIHSPYGVVMMNSILGNAHLNLGEYDDATLYFKYILENAGELGLEENLENAKYDLGNIAIKKKNFKESLKYCTSSWNYFMHSKLLLHKYETCGCLYKSYEGLGDTKNALKYFILAIEFKDSLKNDEQIRESYKMQKKFELEQKDAIFNLKQKQREEINQQKLSTKNYIIGGIIILCIAILALIFAITRSKQRKKEAELAQEKEAAQVKFSQDLILFQEDEKVRISRELHDSVGQDLILLKTKAISNQNTEMEKLIGNTLENVRSITQNLHPFVLEKFGITTALKKLVSDIDSNTDIFVTEEIENIDGLLSKIAELNVYRIIQEVFSNIIKHAQTPSISIEIVKENNLVNLVIKDFGKGFDYSEKSILKNSLGMKTIQERSRIIHAELSIQSEINKGTIVSLKIPTSHA